MENINYSVACNAIFFLNYVESVVLNLLKNEFKLLLFYPT